MLSRFVLFLCPRAAAVVRLLNNQAEHCSRDMSTKASGLNGLSRSLLRMIVTPATHVSQPLPAPLPGTTSTAQVYLNWTRAAHEHWRSQTFTKGGRPPVSRAPRPCQFALPPTQAGSPGCPGSPGHRWGRLPPPEPECVRLRVCPVEAEGEGARAINCSLA